LEARKQKGLFRIAKIEIVESGVNTINQTNQFVIQWKETTIYMRLVSRFIARFSIFIIIFIFTGCNKLKVFGSNKTNITYFCKAKAKEASFQTLPIMTAGTFEP
jgi:hypothetical protein